MGATKGNKEGLKWFILFLACTVTFGGYYSFDFPSVLHNQLRRHFGFDKDDFEFHFSLLYSLYSMPNMILPAFGGILCDVLGNDRVMLGCAALVLLGNVLLLIACVRVDFVILEVGRFVFGLGAETLQVCANTIIAKYFVGAQLAFALGINLSVCKLGGVLTDWVSPYIADSLGIDVAAGVVTGLCTLCFGMTVLLVYHDSHGSLIELMHPYSAKKHSDYQRIPGSDQADGGVIEMEEAGATSSGKVEEITEDDAGTFAWGNFGLSCWLLFVVTFIMYGIFVPFNNISNGVLLEVFFQADAASEAALRRDEVYAARLQSIPYFLSVLITPFLGWAIDRFGYRTAQLVLAALLLALAHVCIFYGNSGPVFPLLLIGLAYSVFGSVSWACVPLIVAPSHHGAAYGVMCAFQNAGQSIVPLFMQQVIRASGHFRDCEMLLAGMAVVSVALSVGLYVLDFAHGNALQVQTV